MRHPMTAPHRNNQINKIKRFSSWNGFPTKIRNFLIKVLKAKLCNDNNITLHANNENNDDSVPKIWLKLPHLGRQGEFLAIKTLFEKYAEFLKFMSKLLSFIKQKRHLSFYPTNIKFRILVRPMLFTNFRALDAVILT